MIYSFESGRHSPKVPNQPKWPVKHLSALALSVALSVGYHNSDQVRENVVSCVEAVFSSLSTNIEDALSGFAMISKS